MDGAGPAPEGDDEAGCDAPTAPGQPAVKVRHTRRQRNRRRRFALVTKKRLKDLAAPLDTPGAELVEVPIIGPVVFALLLALAFVVVSLLVGGFVVAFVELIILGLLAVVGSLWAWLRGHPKVAVMDVDDQRWIRQDGPLVGVGQDEQAVRQGRHPESLGYERLL